MTEPRDDARSELLALADRLTGYADGIPSSQMAIDLRVAATALRPAPARCEAESGDPITKWVCDRIAASGTTALVSPPRLRQALEAIAANKGTDAVAIMQMRNTAICALVSPPSGREALERARGAIEYAIAVIGPDPGGILLCGLNSCDRALSPDPGTVAVPSTDRGGTAK